jgi:L-alanine-DL-glutamate epimerase-like enolase superfamily enzyme
VDKYQAQAVKIKVGALMFMTNDLDAKGPAGRTEQIIPLIRKTFGDDMPLYADANGYYQDPNEAIRVGRLLEEYGYEYFEEPTPCYWHHGTKMVNDALSLPVAGGEQEHSIYGFRWLLANNGLEIVQPNQFYFGGMIRSMKVAQMAHAMGKICTPHLSGGFDYIYMLHFVSAIPNSGPHIEFKGYTDIPMECPTSSLRLLQDGTIQVPTGPGTGVTIDPEYIKACEVIKKV